MNFLKASIKSIFIAISVLNAISCSSDSSPAGASVPSVGTVTVNGKNYTGTVTRTTCYASSFGPFNMGLSQSSISGEIVAATIVLGEQPTISKTYNIIAENGNLSESSVTIFLAVSTLSGTSLQTKTFKPTSGTVQASIEGGKVAVKFSNLPTKIYDDKNVEIGQTIMAGNIKCDN